MFYCWESGNNISIAGENFKSLNSSSVLLAWHRHRYLVVASKRKKCLRPNFELVLDTWIFHFLSIYVALIGACAWQKTFCRGR
jgi:hypothetical protein